MFILKHCSELNTVNLHNRRRIWVIWVCLSFLLVFDYDHLYLPRMSSETLCCSFSESQMSLCQRLWLLDLSAVCVFLCLCLCYVCCIWLFIDSSFMTADPTPASPCAPPPSSCTTLPSSQPHLPGGGHLLRGLLFHRSHGCYCSCRQDSHLLKEERFQQSAGRPQAGQKHSPAQTGNRK